VGSEPEAPRIDPRAAVEASLEAADETARRARSSVDRAIGPATPATAGLSRESTVEEAAGALAGDLMRVPGIRRFADIRLAELDRTGPRPLRTMWRIARDRLERDYGQLTIGEIINRYRGSEGGPSASA
jgi:hypothetical protein